MRRWWLLLVPLAALASASCADLRLMSYRDDALVRQYRYALGEQYVDVKGLKLCYQEMGEGDTVLILPGLVTSIDYWQYNIPELAKHHHVVAVDFPGLGKSDKPDIEYQMAWIMERIADFMDAKGIRRADVIGSSAGGHLALMLALAHPERVSKLVLVGTVGNWDPLTPGQDLAVKLFWSDPLAVHLLRVDWPIIFDWLFYKKTDFTRSILRYDMALRADRPLYTPYGQATGRTMKSLLYSTCRDRLGEIACPVLLIYGEHDRIHRTDHLERHFVEHLKDSRLVIVPEAAHEVMVDQPAVFNALVEGFLERGTAGVASSP